MIALRRRESPLIPFEAGGGALLALIVAAMAFLAACALAAVLGTARLADAWTEGLAGAATVRVSTAEPDAEARLQIALGIIVESEGVIGARVLPTSEVAALLEPWFGEAASLQTLPAPRIIAVTLDDDDPPAPSILQARLDGAGAAAVYDDHGRWRARARDAAMAALSLSAAALGLVVAAMVAVVVFSVRAGMRAQRDVIAALRLAGAEDRFVAKLYQDRFLILGAVGGALGGLIAMALLMGLGAPARLAELAGTPTPTVQLILAAVLIAVLAAALSAFSARFSALTVLRRRG